MSKIGSCDFLKMTGRMSNPSSAHRLCPDYNAATALSESPAPTGQLVRRWTLQAVKRHTVRIKKERGADALGVATAKVPRFCRWQDEAINNPISGPWSRIEWRRGDPAKLIEYLPAKAPDWPQSA